MRRSILAIMVGLIVGSMVQAQEAERVDVTSFEDLTGQYSGGSITDSFVESPVFEEGVEAQDGDAALYVVYDNSSGTWQWAQLDFEAVDASGKTELHMWVYYIPGSVPDPDNGYEIRAELVTANSGNVNLGFQSTDTAGEWVEFVWNISSLSSSMLEEVVAIGGFINPRTADQNGSLYVDNIYFERPAGTPEVESTLVYGFNETDPDTGLTAGWTTEDESVQPVLPGEGEVTPSEGSNYMTLPLTSGWATNVHTANAQDDFNRWDEVREIWLDARVNETPPEWGPQSALIIQTDSGGWDQLAEASYQNAVDAWSTITWTVDMGPHAESIQNQDGSLTIWFSTNNHEANEGLLVFFDNFRVVVPVETGISEWSLY